MVSSAWLSSLAFLSLTLPVVKGQRNTCTRGQDGKNGGRCIRRQGPEFASAFCSSFLPITTPVVTSTTTVTDTTTRDVTSFTDTTTETFSPPATTISSETATFSSTVTETEFNTVITGTITDFVATETTDVTSFSNLYTCPGDPSPSSSSSIAITSSSNFTSSTRSMVHSLTFPTTSKNATIGGSASLTGTIGTGTGIGTGIGTGNGTGIIGTGVSSSFAYSGFMPHYTWTRSSRIPSSSSTPDPAPTSYTLPPYITATYGAYGKEKRQVFGRPPCLQKLSTTSGLAGISDACHCLDIATPTRSQTVETVTDPDTTVTETNVIRTISTFTTIPTVTVTQSVNRTSIFTEFVTSPTNGATTVPDTLTISRTSVSVITNPSPTPSSFNIYYTLNSTQPARFFQAGPAPGGSGIVIANENEADFFTVDGMKRLVDITAGRLFVTKNEQDLYPFTLLQTTAEDDNVPMCEACGGKLQCDFPGTTGNVFALCFDFLALGQPQFFGQDADGDGEADCRIIDLLFK